MGRKKKEEETPIEKALVTNEVFVPLEQHDPVPSLKLTREEMLELQLFEEKGKLADAMVRLKVREKDDLIQLIDPQGKLAALLLEIRANSNKFSESKNGLAELRANIEKRLNISSLGDYAYDEISGVLQKADQ